MVRDEAAGRRAALMSLVLEGRLSYGHDLTVRQGLGRRIYRDSYAGHCISNAT
jgi:hypothetical protein